MTDAASRPVELEAVVKRYPLFSRRRDRALAFLGRTGALRFKTALDGVTLTARDGEAVGLVGENGSGKTSLLRIVAGISPADAGRVRVAAPVSAILELGLGFHGEFTGRENALLYGALMGIEPDVMRDRLGEILSFAELGEYVDQPLRTYSSGMTSRLAFAVATSVEPRVLVVDEALAVGDGGFQKKCIARMKSLKREGRSILFCSHAPYLVAAFCDRVVWLHRGRVERDGSPVEVLPAYETFLRDRGTARAARGEEAGPPSGNVAVLESLRVTGGDGNAVAMLRPGEDLHVEVDVRVLDPSAGVHLGIVFDQEEGACLAGFATHWDEQQPLVGKPRWRARLVIPGAPFCRGRVEVGAFLLDETGLLVLSTLRSAPFEVDSPIWYPAPVLPPHAWTFAAS